MGNLGIGSTIGVTLLLSVASTSFADDIEESCLDLEAGTLCGEDSQGGDPVACTAEADGEDEYYAESSALVFAGDHAGGGGCSRDCYYGFDYFQVTIGTTVGFVVWVRYEDTFPEGFTECALLLCEDVTGDCAELSDECPPDGIREQCGNAHGILAAPTP